MKVKIFGKLTSKLVKHKVGMEISKACLLATNLEKVDKVCFSQQQIQKYRRLNNNLKTFVIEKLQFQFLTKVCINLNEFCFNSDQCSILTFKNLSVA